MLKEARLNLMLTEGANAGDNKSLMVRKLINLAWENPAGLKLHDPISSEKE